MKQFIHLALCTVTVIILTVSGSANAIEPETNKNITTQVIESKYQNVLKVNDKQVKESYLKLAKKLGLSINHQDYFQLLEALKDNIEDSDGVDSKEMIQLYIELATVESTNQESQSFKRKKQKYLRIAAKTAEHFEDKEPEYRAYVDLTINKIYIKEGGLSPKRFLSRLKKNQRFYHENHPETSIERLTSNLNIGVYNYALGLGNQTFLKKEKKAQGYYQEAISLLNANLLVLENAVGPTNEIELETRAALISALEASGDSAAATKHCIAIGAMRPWAENQQQKPLFRVEPLYPISARRRGQSGLVNMEFTISEDGIVKDVKVLNSEGGVKFEQAAITAVEKWRYAPKFENNQAIAAKSTVELGFHIQR